MSAAALPFSKTTIEFTREALYEFCSAYPEARFWDCKLEELHSLPDCAELYADVIVRMYECAEAAPREARGHCRLGTCASRVSTTQISVHVMDNFTTKLHGHVFMTRSGTLMVHSDARCAGSGSRASVVCRPINYALELVHSSRYKLCPLCM